MTTIQTHIDLLGKTVRDRVTGLTGVVTTVAFDLYGCIQATVHPGLDKDNKPLEQHWFDVSRLDVQPGSRVMPVPAFSVPGPISAGEKGAAEKPAQMKV